MVVHANVPLSFFSLLVSPLRIMILFPMDERTMRGGIGGVWHANEWWSYSPPPSPEWGGETQISSDKTPPSPTNKTYVCIWSGIHKLFIGRGCVDIIGNYHLSVLFPQGKYSWKKCPPVPEYRLRILFRSRSLWQDKIFSALVIRCRKEALLSVPFPLGDVQMKEVSPCTWVQVEDSFPVSSYWWD